MNPYIFPAAIVIVLCLVAVLLTVAMKRLAAWDDAHREDDDYHSEH